jgi:hypothetical protein
MGSGATREQFLPGAVDDDQIESHASSLQVALNREPEQRHTADYEAESNRGSDRSTQRLERRHILSPVVTIPWTK